GNMGHPVHLHGHLFKIVATDGNPVPEAAQLTKDTVWIAPGERYDIELVADNPGIWMVHCHIENHAANGMMTLIEYEGEVPTGPLAEVWNTDSGLSAPMDHSAHGAPATTPEPTPTTAPVETPATAATPAASTEPPADAAVVSMVDDRFGPKELMIKAGTTVTFVNNGSNWHSVAAIDGSFTSAQIKSGDSYTVTFETPGTYMYICRHHARAGMIGTIVVTE
ncbi:MAG: multicopper oxidase domain-containing protein, partial [Thermomicrobiales bacterium]|nr:multicopper oxidase domain-containing protein [Thermomicrobiales bacterium]